MANTIKLLDVAALTADLAEYNLRRGQDGTSVVAGIGITSKRQ